MAADTLPQEQIYYSVVVVESANIVIQSVNARIGHIIVIIARITIGSQISKRVL